MEKTIIIEGMSCSHCKARVEKVLSSLDGVQSATVDLAKKQAVIITAKQISDQTVKTAIEDAGYEVISIK